MFVIATFESKLRPRIVMLRQNPFLDAEMTPRFAGVSFVAYGYYQLG